MKKKQRKAFEKKVERIAEAWYESPGPDDDVELIWELAHPGDQEIARYNVRFILAEAGVE